MALSHRTGRYNVEPSFNAWLQGALDTNAPSLVSSVVLVPDYPEEPLDPPCWSVTWMADTDMPGSYQGNLVSEGVYGRQRMAMVDIGVWVSKSNANASWRAQLAQMVDAVTFSLSQLQHGGLIIKDFYTSATAPADTGYRAQVKEWNVLDPPDDPNPAMRRKRVRVLVQWLERSVAPVSDTFASDSGLWKDETGADAAMTISNGRGIWSPSDGSEALSNTDFGAWTDDDPDSWLVIEDAGNNELTEVAAGESYADAPTADGDHCCVYRASGNLVAAQFSALTAGAWYKVVAEVDTVTTNYADLVLGANVAVRANQTGTLTGTHYASNANYGLSPATTCDVTLASNSAKPLTGVWRVRRVYVTSSVQADVWRSAWTQGGVGLWKDANNWILATLSGPDDLLLLKCVAGTVLPVNSTTITESGGATLKLTPNRAFTAFTVSYNDVDELSDQSITGWAGTGHEWSVGLFSTYNAGDSDTDAFDNFSAVEV